MAGKRLTEKGAFISKSEAVMLQAVAVMLMVWHHLYFDPSRISEPYVLILNRFFHCERELAYFGKICVATFAFLSGYGMRKKAIHGPATTSLLEDYKTIVRQLLKFISRYWMVFFTFVPLGYLLRVHPFDFSQFLRGLLGKEHYNAEWWYITFYFRFLLLFPLVNQFINCICRVKPVLLHIFMLLCLAGCAFFPKDNPHYGFVLYFCCFLEGMYFVDSGAFEALHRLLPGKSWIQLGIGAVMFAVVFFVRDRNVADFWLVAAFVCAVTLICKAGNVLHWFRTVLMFVGKYSTYIWLTHTFFAYYYFQKLTFIPRYSWLIFLWCMVLSIASGMILEGLLTLLGKGFKKIVIRKK